MRFLAVIGLLALIIAVAAASYFFLGFYNVAASGDDPDIVKSALIRVRNASIAKKAGGQPPFREDDAAAVSQGARRFAEAGCVSCHGAPGAQWAKFSEGLNPDPPDLTKTAAARPIAEVFWIVKNGIRMTGMPSFSKAGLPDDQIWQIAAFVKKLPTVSEADYKNWTTAAAAQ
jgi:mono/diheme cytochrome c family protein